MYQFQTTYPHTPHLYLLLSISTFIIIDAVVVIIVIMVVLSVIAVIFGCFFHGLISAFGSKLLFFVFLNERLYERGEHCQNSEN